MVIQREFSTPNADYIFQGRTHQTKNDVLIEADALILETGYTQFKNMKLEYRNVIGSPQNLENSTQHLDEGKPIYSVDPGARSVRSIMYDLTISLQPLAISILTSTYFPVESAIIGGLSASVFLGEMLAWRVCTREDKKRMVKKHSFLTESMALSSAVLQTAIVAGRNAIMARKLEEYVAPTLEEELGRKPTIGLLMGAAHTGIEWDLKNPMYRDLVIKNFELLDIKPYNRFNIAQVDSVLEMRAKNGVNSVDINIHDTKLFPRALKQIAKQYAGREK